MYTEMLHLFFGNLLIGILEGALLRLIFKARLLRSTLIMVAANYLSMLAGAFLTDAALHSASPSPSLYVVRWYVYGALPVSFLVTVILEWPFIRAALAGLALPWRKALLGSLAVQTVSYALLAPFYLAASDIRLLANTHIEPTPEFVKNRGALVYFTSLDSALFRVRLDGSGLEHVTTVPPRHYVGQTEYPVHDLREESDKLWQVDSGRGLAQSLTIWQTARRESPVTLALETPFLHWGTYQATVLPGDEVVFQLGPDIICVFDRETRKLAQLARGRGPVVALDDPRAPK